MQTVTTIGLDIAKSVFQVHGHRSLPGGTSLGPRAGNSHARRQVLAGVTEDPCDKSRVALGAPLVSFEP